MGQTYPRARAAATAAVALGCAAAMLLPVRQHPVVVLGLGFAVIIALGRTRLDWTAPIPGAPLVRMVIRQAAFLLPMVALGLPALLWSPVGTACAVLLAICGLVAERRNIRLSFDPAFLQAAAYRNRIGRVRDVMLSVGSGVVQEYFYRWAVLAVLTPIIGIWSLPVGAGLFVAEHLAQAGSVWDRHDVAWQLVLSFGLGGIVLATGSLPAAVIGHVLYNSPSVVHALMRPRDRAGGAHRGAETGGAT